VRRFWNSNRLVLRREQDDVPESSTTALLRKAWCAVVEAAAARARKVSWRPRTRVELRTDFQWLLRFPGKRDLQPPLVEELPLDFQHKDLVTSRLDLGRKVQTTYSFFPEG
jgi:hypothetical protein